MGSLLKYYPFVILGAVFLIHLIAIIKSYKIIRFIAKPFIMPLLLLSYISFTNSINLHIVTGLSFAFWGDLFMIFQRKKAFFLGGMIAFALTHIFYIFAFVGNPGYFMKMIPTYWFISIPYIVFGLLILKQIIPHAKDLKIPVVIYTVIIIIMSISSWLRLTNYKGFQLWCPIIGALLFILSDSILALNKFKHKTKHADFFIAVSYITAQLLIVAGFI